MKRSFRVLSSALAALTLVSAMAVGVSAAGGALGNAKVVYEDINGKRDLTNIKDYVGSNPIQIGDKDVVIKAKDYDQIIYLDGMPYELYGMGYNKFLDGMPVRSGLSDQLTIKGGQDASYYANLGFLDLVYGQHFHTIDPNKPWYFDNNLHWKYCEVCGTMVARYHQDLDNDGTCDICKQPIHYRYVTVKDAPGGKVEISKEKCMLTNRVAITVTPDEGYELSDIRGINDNEMQSVRPCYVDRQGSRYHLIVDVWDVEIQPTFVKK